MQTNIEYPIYKLFEQIRCYGNQTVHENECNIFITETYNMIDLLNYIKKEGNKTKSYVIFKYIGTNIQTRQLSRGHNGSYEKGNKTNTWFRYFYCLKKNDWKETNYRYNNEKIF